MELQTASERFDPRFADEQLIDKLGITIDRCEPGIVSGAMPVDGNRQPIGLLHGGANAVFAETLGSLAAYVHAGPGGNAVGIDLSCTHHRWISSGVLRGVATALHEGVRTATYSISITGPQGQLICSSRLTAAVTKTQEQS